MKNDMLQIAYALEKGIISEEEAKKSYIELFGIKQMLSDVPKYSVTPCRDYSDCWLQVEKFCPDTDTASPYIKDSDLGDIIDSI